MFDVLLPKGAPFFDMLLQQNAMLVSMMKSIVEYLEKCPLEQDKHHKINTHLEEQGDSLYGKIIRELTKSFITPIDREDILRIGQKQEESMDCLHGLSIRLHIFGFRDVRFPALQLARTIVAMLELTTTMLEALSKKENRHKARAFRALRDECDSILAVGLAELMEEREDITHRDFLTLLKWNQVYERLSLVLEDIVRLGETIEEAVLKHV